MATRTKQKNMVERVVDSAASAAEELGAAASAFKESWSHVKKAQEVGKPATTAAARAGKAVVRTTKRAASATARGAAKVTRVAKKTMSGTSSRRHSTRAHRSHKKS